MTKSSKLHHHVGLWLSNWPTICKYDNFHIAEMFVYCLMPVDSDQVIDIGCASRKCFRLFVIRYVCGNKHARVLIHIECVEISSDV